MALLRSRRLSIHHLTAALSIVFLLIAIVRAIQLRWISDDSFISFRYAQNLVRGHGLVFNVGERVEGYTNFLWTLVIAAGMKLRIDPIPWTNALGILGYAGTIAVLVIASRRSDRAGFLLPIAAIACALHRDLQVWATGGLETSWVTLAITSGIVLLSGARQSRKIFAASFLLVMGILLRPDAVVPYCAGALFLAVVGPRHPSALLAYVLPFVLVIVPYWYLRAGYYGHFFPNTYYAKSAHLPYYEQGLKYVGLYATTYPSFVVLLVTAAVSAIVLWRPRGRSLYDETERFLILAALVMFSSTFYIIRIGGDFMFARFLIPITPIAFLAGECALRRFVADPRLRLVCGVVLAASVLLRPNVFANEVYPWGVANEPAHYPDHRVGRARAERVGQILRGTGVTVAFYGGYAKHAFYSEVDPAIEAATGLTDEPIAHLPLVKRGVVGHEKTVSAAYLVQRGARIALRGPHGTGKGFVMPEEWSSQPTKMFRLKLGDFTAMLLAYDCALMEKLSHFEDVEFFDLPKYLDGYLASVDQRPIDKVRNDYRFLKKFYFEINDDPAREARFLSRLESSHSEIEGDANLAEVRPVPGR